MGTCPERLVVDNGVSPKTRNSSKESAKHQDWIFTVCVKKLGNLNDTQKNERGGNSIKGLRQRLPTWCLWTAVAATAPKIAVSHQSAEKSVEVVIRNLSGSLPSRVHTPKLIVSAEIGFKRRIREPSGRPIGIIIYTLMRN